jgi:hypothetical protein
MLTEAQMRGLKCKFCGRSIDIVDLKYIQFRREDEKIWDTALVCVEHIEGLKKKHYEIVEVE